jgi:dipeptidyl-peptidase 4
VDLDGHRVPVTWDHERFEYLVDVEWSPDGPLTVVVQTRDQRTVRFLAVDPERGGIEVIQEQHDPSWIEIVPGSPRWTPAGTQGGGRLVHVADLPEARALWVDGAPVTGPQLQVRRLVDAGGADALVIASDEPTTPGPWLVDYAGGNARRLGAPGAWPTPPVKDRSPCSSPARWTAPVRRSPWTIRAASTP